MKTKKSSRSVRIFRMLLRAFPPEFRWQFGRDMEQGFREEHVEEQHTKGMSRFMTLWLETLGDIFRTAPREHLDLLKQDVVYGLRVLAKDRGFTSIAIIVLALGIGANTAVFSVIYPVLIRALPFREPSRLVMPAYALHEVSPANFIDYREQNHVFEDMGALQYWSANLIGVDPPERLQGFIVSPSLFTLLGVKPLIGRHFLSEEEQPGRDNVVILSQGLWERRFGSDPDLIGKTLTINGRIRTVVGVMPAGFEIHGVSDVWAPLAFDDRTRMIRQSQYLTSVARLKPGVTLQQAQADMSAIREGIEQTHPNVNVNRMKIVPLREQIVGPVGPALLILFGAVGFVLLIACANIASLQLARTASRQREMAVRTALGARRARIIRQLLTESVMLALAAGAAGLLVAVVSVHLLVAAMPASSPLASFSGFREIGVDKAALTFTLATALITGIVFGLAPALKGASPDLNETLKEGGRWAAGSLRTRRLRGLLVVSEIALSLVLLIGSGLMVRSFNGLMKVDPGFDPRNVLSMQFYLLPFKYKQPAQAIAFYRQALDQIRNLPGVVAAGLTSNLPLGASDNSDGFSIEGQPDPPKRDERIAHIRTVTADYFKSLGIPIARGRAFTDQDNETAPGVAIINETLAKQYWPDRDPVGERIRTSSAPGSPPQPWLSIVGIARDVRHTGLSMPPEPELYEPYFQNPDQGATLVVRTASDPTSLIAAVRAEILKLDKDQPVYAIRTMEAVLSDSLLLNRLPMILLSAFASVALVLAAVGIYGVLAYSVVQRTHEIGIRIALGAAGRNVLALVLTESGILTSIGLALGLAAALALTRLMATLLFGVTPTDLATFVAIPVVLALVALIASYIPARRASKVDPVIALRDE